MSASKFLILLTACAILALPATPPQKHALYAAVGPEILHFDADITAATLARRDSITLPGAVQYAWPHPSHRWLYVAWSDAAHSRHGLSALEIAPSGALRPIGDAVSLPSRPIHVSADIPGRFVLVAYNNPSGLTVHPISETGVPGQAVPQTSRLDFGIYAHQVRVDLSNKLVILVTRGNGPADGRPEDPGALNLFEFVNGSLTNRASIAPNNGMNFQPRHIDFDPAQRWVYASLERQNKLQVYELRNGQTLSASPIFERDSLINPDHGRPAQMAGTVHVHPSGNFVYQANRASGMIDYQGSPIFAGGENSIAVYSIDRNSGEPKLIQSADTRGLHPRTFTLDSSASVLVAANQMSLAVREADGVKTIPASLTVFRVAADGTLSYIRKYDIETGGGRSLFWTAFVPLP